MSMRRDEEHSEEIHKYGEGSRNLGDDEGERERERRGMIMMKVLGMESRADIRKCWYEWKSRPMCDHLQLLLFFLSQ